MSGLAHKIREMVAGKDSLVHSDQPSKLEQERELGTAGHEGTGPRDPTTGHLSGEANPVSSLVGMSSDPRATDDVDVEPGMQLQHDDRRNPLRRDPGADDLAGATATHTGVAREYPDPDAGKRDGRLYEPELEPRMQPREEVYAAPAPVPLREPVAREPEPVMVSEPVVQQTTYTRVAPTPILGEVVHDGPLPRDTRGHILEDGTHAYNHSAQTGSGVTGSSVTGSGMTGSGVTGSSGSAY